MWVTKGRRGRFEKLAAFGEITYWCGRSQGGFFGLSQKTVSRVLPSNIMDTPNRKFQLLPGFGPRTRGGPGYLVVLHLIPSGLIEEAYQVGSLSQEEREVLVCQWRVVDYYYQQPQRPFGVRPDMMAALRDARLQYAIGKLVAYAYATREDLWDFITRCMSHAWTDGVTPGKLVNIDKLSSWEDSWDPISTRIWNRFCYYCQMSGNPEGAFDHVCAEFSIHDVCESVRTNEQHPYYQKLNTQFKRVLEARERALPA